MKSAPRRVLWWLGLAGVSTALGLFAQVRQESHSFVLKTELLPTPPGRLSAPSITLDGSGRPTVAWSHADTGEPATYLLQWTGERWSELDHSASGRGLSNTAGRALAPSVQVDSHGWPAVAWQDLSYGNWEVYFKRWNGSAWEEVGGSATKGGISQTLSGLSVDAVLALPRTGGAVVAWEERFGANSDLYIRSLQGGSRQAQWKDIGPKSGLHGGFAGKIGRSAFPSMVLDERDRPVMAWQDSVTGAFQVFLKRWTGSKWEEVGGSATGGGISHGAHDSIAPSVALDSSGLPLVAWQQQTALGQSIHFSRWDGKQWSGLGSSAMGEGVSTGLSTASLPSLAVSADRPVIAFQAGQKGHARIYVRRWAGTEWEPWPGTVDGLLVQSGANAEAVRLAASSKEICLTWMETLGREKRIAVACR